jgi:peroxiredoxin
MSDLRSQIEGFAEGLSLKEKATVTRLLISLDKNETAKATAAKKQLLSLFTLAAKSQGKKRDLYTSALNKYLAAQGPEWIQETEGQGQQRTGAA